MGCREGRASSGEMGECGEMEGEERKNPFLFQPAASVMHLPSLFLSSCFQPSETLASHAFCLLGRVWGFSRDLGEMEERERGRRDVFSSSDFLLIGKGLFLEWAEKRGREREGG